MTYSLMAESKKVSGRAAATLRSTPKRIALGQCRNYRHCPRTCSKKSSWNRGFEASDVLSATDEGEATRVES